MQTTEGLNLPNSLKQHNNGLALKSKWARSSFWDKSRNMHPGRCCSVCWSAENYTRPNIKRGVCSKNWASNLKPWSPKWVLPHWALPLKITSAFLRVRRSKWWINFIFFLFPKTPLFKEKSKLCKQPLLLAFCLKQGISYYNVRNWFTFRCSMKSVLEATPDYEQSATQTLQMQNIRKHFQFLFQGPMSWGFSLRGVWGFFCLLIVWWFGGGFFSYFWLCCVLVFFKRWSCISRELLQTWSAVGANPFSSYWSGLAGHKLSFFASKQIFWSTNSKQFTLSSRRRPQNV